MEPSDVSCLNQPKACKRASSIPASQLLPHFQATGMKIPVDSCLLALRLSWPRRKRNRRRQERLKLSLLRRKLSALDHQQVAAKGLSPVAPSPRLLVSLREHNGWFAGKRRVHPSPGLPG
jgi:hypothetical protein